MGQFLAALRDEDPNVRRVALVAFNSAAHNKPSLVRDLLDDVLPQLYEETKIKVCLEHRLSVSYNIETY
jgi:cullin-associated NEDD8-dissociated protein 1